MTQEKKQNVLINKDDILNFTMGVGKEYEIKIPEWKDISEGVLVVRPAQLDDHISAQNTKVPTKIMMEYYNDCREKNIEPDTKEIKRISEIGNLHEKTQFELQIFQRCVIKPLFSIAEVVEVSKVFPEVINRVVKTILSLSAHRKETNNGSNETD